ncbi:chloride channel protein EriC [Gallibacterium genomosp. 3]|uniref:Chloride channel protein EriC n=1 Tax=Gallibacterium genomosp. 3 TaxID=505345 RepID=A0A1A7PSP0_9PAST|nr:chloride channel protein [Gallibacterium genomosp. 3]OBX04761.1 chloride channel protein EriC [Gallibacterium genomosp. 3]
MFFNLKAKLHQLNHYLKHKGHQTSRLSRKSIEFICLLCGALLVALVSWGFATLVELGLEINTYLVNLHPWVAWVLLPFGMAILAWFTQRFTPYVAGSGIPQVIASIGLPHGKPKEALVRLAQTIWKIPLTFLAMCCGASVGREGPSVQVGAAVMLSWGKFCRKYNLAFKGLSYNELIATGAAGGLAAAFNAPLAGVIFAIEEIGRGAPLRWERRVLLGVLAAGFMLVLIQGNNPYFPQYAGADTVENVVLWLVVCAVVCGLFGGAFARLLAKGLAAYLPAFMRGFVRRHPIIIAFILGILLAGLGIFSNHQTYGTGYAVVTQALNDQALDTSLGISKLLATVFTYWTGIAGGIFTPALTTGAAIGSNIWQLTGGIVDQRFLVLLSMAAFLSGATQSPVTSSVVVMEMTGSQPELVWLLATSIMASIISRQICPKPFYHFAAGRFRQRIQEQINQEQQKLHDNQ